MVIPIITALIIFYNLLFMVYIFGIWWLILGLFEQTSWPHVLNNHWYQMSIIWNFTTTMSWNPVTSSAGPERSKNYCRQAKVTGQLMKFASESGIKAKLIREMSLFYNDTIAQSILLIWIMSWHNKVFCFFKPTAGTISKILVPDM